MADEAIRLLLDIAKFLESSKDGAAALARMKGETDKLDTSVKQAEKSTYEFADVYDLVTKKTDRAATATHTLTTDTHALAEQYRAAARAKQQHIDDLETIANKGEKAAKSTRNMGQAGLTAGRAIQDFAQGGLGGILNNVEGLVMAFGGPAGLAGILTAVGVAAFIAKPFLKEFWDALMGNPEAIKQGTEAIKERIKAIEDKPIKLAIDLKELAAAQKQLKDFETAVAAFERLRESKTEATAKAAATMEKILTEAQQPRLAEQLKAAAAANLEDTPEIQKAKEDLGMAARKAGDLKRQLDHPEGGVASVRVGVEYRAAEAQVEAAKEALAQRRQEIQKKGGTAEGVVGHATDALKRGDPTEMAKQLRAIGRADLAEQLEASTPAGMKKTAFEEDQARGTIQRGVGRVVGPLREALERHRIEVQQAEELKQAAAQARAEQNASVAKRDAEIERKGRQADQEAGSAAPRRRKPRNIRERLERAKDRRAGATFDEAMEQAESGRIPKKPETIVIGSEVTKLVAQQLEALTAEKEAVTALVGAMHGIAGTLKASTMSSKQTKAQVNQINRSLQETAMSALSIGGPGS